MIWQSHSFTGHIPIIQSDTCNPVFTGAIFTTAKHGNSLDVQRGVFWFKLDSVGQGQSLSLGPSGEED